MNKKASSLAELFDGFDYEAYWEQWEKEHPGQSKEVDWGGPVGKEVFYCFPSMCYAQRMSIKS